MGWRPKEDGFPVLLLLKSLLGCSLHLERFALINCCTKNLSLWDHPPDTSNFLIDFASKMKRLVCCCLLTMRWSIPFTVNLHQHFNYPLNPHVENMLLFISAMETLNLLLVCDFLCVECFMCQDTELQKLCVVFCLRHFSIYLACQQ